MEKRLYMGIFDSVLVKYGAILVGYGIIGIPVFGKNHNKYLTATEKDAG
jgi:ATP-binding cassette subfamily D (ALD) protein 3